MNRVVGYARCANNYDVLDVRHEMDAWCICERAKQLDAFDFDFLSGKRGLIHTLRFLELGDTLIIRHLSNLGRTPHELLKNAHDLLHERGVSIMVLSTRLFFRAGANQPDTRVFLAILQAHDHYIQENIKLGMQAALAGGATIGRPPRQDLLPEVASKRIQGLRDAKTGRLPSIRKLAAELKCGKRKAGELLDGFKAKEEAI